MARGTLVAGVNSRPCLAIESLCQDTRGRGFSHPPRTSEQEGVRYSFLRDRILQRLGNRSLAHDFFEDLGSPFSGEYEIGHFPSFQIAGFGIRIELIYP